MTLLLGIAVAHQNALKYCSYLRQAAENHKRFVSGSVIKKISAHNVNRAVILESNSEHMYC